MEKYILLIVLSLCGNVVPEVADTTSVDQKGKTPYAFEGIINSTITGILAELDPITIDGPLIDLTLPENSLINGRLALSDVSVTGLSKAVLPVIVFSIIGYRLNFTVDVPTLEVNAGYDTDLVLLNIPHISGNGNASIRINGLQLIGYLRASLSPLQLTDFSIQLGLENVDVDIEGLKYSACSSNPGEITALGNLLVNSVANDVIVSFLNTNAQVISDTISPIIKDVINALLSSLSGDGSDSQSARLVKDLNTILLEKTSQD